MFDYNIMTDISNSIIQVSTASQKECINIIDASVVATTSSTNNNPLDNMLVTLSNISETDIIELNLDDKIVKWDYSKNGNGNGNENSNLDLIVSNKEKFDDFVSIYKKELYDEVQYTKKRKVLEKMITGDQIIDMQWKKKIRDLDLAHKQRKLIYKGEELSKEEIKETIEMYENKCNEIQNFLDETGLIEIPDMSIDILLDKSEFINFVEKYNKKLKDKYQAINCHNIDNLQHINECSINREVVKFKKIANNMKKLSYYVPETSQITQNLIENTDFTTSEVPIAEPVRPYVTMLRDFELNNRYETPQLPASETHELMNFIKNNILNPMRDIFKGHPDSHTTLPAPSAPNQDPHPQLTPTTLKDDS